MSGPDLQSLERDVAQARTRLAHNLARLRSPETISEFKESLWAEARETRDELVQKTKDAATDGIQRIVADLKERAAANPVAVLAIGAGLAWRLAHRPPIASLLVGIGLVGLFRPVTGAEAVAGASKLLHSAKDTVQEWSEDLRQASSDGMSEIADRATVAAGQISEAARETVTRIKDGMRSAADQASEAGQEGLVQVRTTAASATDGASSILQDAVSDAETRDRYLLGAAAFAVAAAVGIAYQRRAADGADRS
jgi:hypothetical protein